jgi:hypothetical protein
MQDEEAEELVSEISKMNVSVLYRRNPLCEVQRIGK